MDRKEKHKVQSNKLYESYGKFAVEFEHMCLNIKTCITFVFHNNGLKDQQLIRILLADQTAYPLIAKLRSIVAIGYVESPEVINHLKPLFKFCIDLNEKRNDIIHGTWFVGWASQEQEEFNVASGVKDKITAKGVTLNKLSYEHVNFDELTEKIKIAKNLFSRLNVCIISGEDVIKNVELSEIEKLKDSS